VEELDMTVAVKWSMVGRCRCRRGDGVDGVDVGDMV
jgi:hypothetical protein